MYAECQNYSLVAKAFGVSVSTVRRHCNGDAETVKIVQQKKAENTTAVLEYMNGQKNQVCCLLDHIIQAMDDTAKMERSSLPQLATALGILVDKYTANEDHAAGTDPKNNLFEIIQQSTQEELHTDGISEIERPAEPSHDMVE